MEPKHEEALEAALPGYSFGSIEKNGITVLMGTKRSITDEVLSHEVYVKPGSDKTDEAITIARHLDKQANKRRMRFGGIVTGFTASVTNRFGNRAARRK